MGLGSMLLIDGVGPETVTEFPGELLAVIDVCVWQRAVTTIIFWPVLDQEWDAERVVDHADEVPSPQLKLYWRVCPRLEEAAPTLYVYDVLSNGLGSPVILPGRLIVSDAGCTVT